MEEMGGRIKTVVVLMLENRSFDHMLGWMKRVNPEIDGVTGGEWNPISTENPHQSRKIFFKDTAEYVDPDPGHSFDAVTHQVLGSKRHSSEESGSEFLQQNHHPPMDGFAEQAESVQPGMSEIVMNGFSPEAVPVFKTLVEEFAVFDRWFSSLPTLTQPNRLFIHSATSNGEVINDTSNLVEGYPQKTIFQSIEESGLDFAVYYQSFPNVLFYRRMRNPKYARKFHRYERKFRAHARKGKLPNYVVIEPRYFDGLNHPANDDHPSHDVAHGQALVKEVYEALRASPQWNEIALVITYDEHGGFFDHVPTPSRGVPNPDGLVSAAPHFFAFDRLGVRVPTIVVSPWINKATVVHEPHGPYRTSQYEHSSVPATVKKLFNLKSDFLTKRDEWAGTFDHLFYARDTPRTDCPETLPSPPRLRKSAAKEEAPLSEFQREMTELAAHLRGRFFHRRHRGFANDSNQEEEEEAAKLIEEMNVGDAREFVEGAVNDFFGKSFEGNDGSASSSSSDEGDGRERQRHHHFHGAVSFLHKLVH